MCLERMRDGVTDGDTMYERVFEKDGNSIGSVREWHGFND